MQSERGGEHTDMNAECECGEVDGRREKGGKRKE